MIQRNKKAFAKNLESRSGNHLADLYDIHDSNSELVERKIREIEIKLAKLSSIESTYTHFEDKQATIITEMEKFVRLDSYVKLIEYYRKHSDFNDHLLMRICILSQGILLNLVKVSKTFRANSNSILATMYSYYKDEVPQDRLTEVNTANIRLEKSTKVPDHIIVLMFISKITCMIQVLVPSTQAITMQYFQMHPKCFFLSNETKEAFIEDSEPTALVSELINHHRDFVVEMNYYEMIFKKSALLYKLALEDNITILRYVLWFTCLIMNIFLVYDRTRLSDGEPDYLTFTKVFFDSCIGRYRWPRILACVPLDVEQISATCPHCNAATRTEGGEKRLDDQGLLHHLLLPVSSLQVDSHAVSAAHNLCPCFNIRQRLLLHFALDIDRATLGNRRLCSAVHHHSPQTTADVADPGAVRHLRICLPDLPVLLRRLHCGWSCVCPSLWVSRLVPDAFCQPWI
jgi:hypothetical protein